MKTYQVSASPLSGACDIPASKSQSIRAILFASMADGRSTIDHFLPSPDIAAMITACRQLGADIQEKEQHLLIDGVNGRPQTPDNVIDAGNSGQVLRFIACLAGLQNNHMVITGDASIRSNRPVKPLIEALPQLGVMCDSLQGNGFAPLILKGPFSSNSTKLSGEDSQPVSGLLMAAAFASGDTQIQVRNPGEKPWIALTLNWLDRFNIPYQNDDFNAYHVSGGNTITGFNYRVPGDLSSLSFPLVAALITQSEIIIHNVDMNEPQGDKAIVALLQAMGADIEIDADAKTLTVAAGAKLQGIDIDINDCIDCIAILAVVGCFASGTTRISGAAIAREKESDRIAAITTELNKMGAVIEETADGMVIQHADLHGAQVESHHDHRIAMSLSVAGMAADGETLINDVSCVDKSFPGFAASMRKLGATICQHES